MKLTRTGRLALAAAGAVAVAVPTATAATSAPVVTSASVSSATSADPDAGVLAAHLLDQQITWEKCNFDAELMAVPGVACGNLTVPRDWHNPTDGHTITLRISKTETAGADRQGIALVNPGGPSASGLMWGAAMAVRTPELAEHYDFYGFDPRGVQRSGGFLCSYVPTPGATEAEDLEARVNGCLDNPLTPFINTEQTAYDMDFIRAYFGEEKLSYMGFSYGTWLGKWYETLFPSHVHRFLLDSATDLTRKSLEATWDLQPPSRDRQFQERLLPFIARNNEAFGLPEADPIQLRRYWEQADGNRSDFGQLLTAYFILPGFYNNDNYPTAAAAAAIILREGVARTPLPTGLSPAESRTRLAAVVDEIEAMGTLSAAQRSTLRTMEANAFADLDQQIAVDQAAAAGTAVKYDMTFEMIRCQDGQWTQSAGHWKAWVDDLLRKAPWIGVFMSAPACQYWPASTEMPQVLGNEFPDTLILQSELDAATAYEGGRRSAQLLPNTSLISVDNEGTHGLYPYGTTCVDDAVNAYFLDGVLPPKFTACQGKPLPAETETFEVAGTLGANQKIRIKMVTPDVREANRIYRERLAELLVTAENGL